MLAAMLLAMMLPTGVALADAITLSFATLPAVTYGDGPVDASLYVTPDGSANAITYASSTLPNCTVDPVTGSITIVGAGSCSITATQSAVDATDTFSIGKATPACAILGYSVTFNGSSHTATGNCTGVGSVVLAGLVKTSTTHTNAGTYNNDPWTFTDATGNYFGDAGTVDSTIAKANPDCTSVSGYAATYTGSAHTAGGNCIAVDGTTHLAGLDVTGTSHTNVGTFNNDPWSFHDAAGNYNDDSGTVNDSIGKASAVCTSIVGYSVTYNGSSHTATGHCLAVDGTTQLAGVNLAATTHTNAGNYTGDAWTFNDVTGNYNNTSGTVNDAIAKASANCSSIVGYSVTYDGSPHTATGHCLALDGTTQLAGVSLVGTTHANASTYNNDPWTFAGTSNYSNTSGTVNDAIAKAGQTLLFDVSAAGKTFGDPAFGLGTFTTPGASGGAVTYVSQTGPVCTVVGSTLTIHKVGLCTIKASQAGDANHNAAADVTSGFTVAKAAADCSSIVGYTVTYDTNAHTATGACLAVDGTTELAGLDLTATTHTLAGTYIGDAWTFTDVTGNYIDASGTVNDTIGKAAASCSLFGYTVTFDGAAHTATGSCTGIGGVPLGGLDLSGTTHTNAGTHSDPWAFTDVTGDYQDQSGSVSDTISKANADCSSVTAYAATYDTTAHTASGSCLALDGLTPLGGLNLSGTTHTNAGTYSNDPWSFADVTGNYNDASGTVDDAIAKGPQVIDFTSNPPATVNLGDHYDVTATASDGGTVTFTIDATATTICSMATSTQVHFDARGACVVDGSEPGDSNYLPGAGQQSIPVSDIPPTCTDASATVITVIMNAPQTGTIGTTGSSATLGSPTCSDAEGDIPLTYSVDAQGAQGTAAFIGSQWTYTPGANALGSDSFTIRAQDTLSAFSLPSAVNVNIVNRPVKAKTDAVTVSAVAPSSINVLANDLAGYDASAPTKNQDPGQPLTITAVTQGSLGVVTTDGHAARYDPNGCSYGSDLFSYTVTDGLTVSTAYVAVTVAKPGQAGRSKTPLTNTPASSFILGSKTSATVPLRVAWCGLTATSSRIYRVLQSSNGGVTFPSVVASATKLTSAIRSLTVGANYAWRVRTSDGAGRVSAYATSITSKVLRFDNTNPSIAYSAGWGLVKSSLFSGGSEVYATSAAASATLALPAGTRAFAIVSSRASNRGSFKVFVDGVLVATVSQKVSKTVYQIVVYSRAVTSTASHTIVIQPAGNGRIDLDAILTLQ
jgi:hypothetical protein